MQPRLMDDFTFDHERRARLGFPEAVYCAGKTTDQIARIIETVVERPLLLTRLDADTYQALAVSEPHLMDPLAGILILGTLPEIRRERPVAIVTGGTSDMAVAQEAKLVLRFVGWDATMIGDVGVAGLWRLTSRLDEIARHQVVIAAAGMDAALPTVLAGLIPNLVIAVPTSVGYGAARGGETALMALLASCAPGLVVTNIDNGFGAAVAAVRALRGMCPA